MDFLISSPFPVPTFQSAGPNGESCPKDLLDFLTSLLSRQLNGDSSKKVSAGEKEGWVSLLSLISDQLMPYFPSYDSLPWSTMHEKVKVIDIALDVFLRAMDYIDGLYRGSISFSMKLFARILELCHCLDNWLDVEVVEEEGFSSPLDLRNKAFMINVALLRCMGDNITISGGYDELPWRDLRVLLLECLDLIYDLEHLSPPLTFPLTIALFSKPRIREGKKITTSTPAAKDTSVTLNLETASQLPVFQSLLLSFLTSALCPATLAQDFLTDVVRRTTEATRAIFNYCLSPSCVTTAFKRARSVARVINCAASLSSLPVDFGSSLGDLFSRLLLYRLEQGPRTDWHEVDSTLSTVFGRSLALAPAKAHIISMIEIIRVEDWDDSAKELVALAISYLRRCLSYVPEDVLLTIKDVLSAKDFIEKAELIGDIDRCISALASNAELHSIEGSQVENHISWRTTIRTSVDEIIEPDQVGWMDDDSDASFTDDLYAKRALEEVRNRFTRPLRITSAEARVSLAQALARLPCAIVHPEIAECVVLPNKHNILTVPPLLTVISRLLDGPEDEVTPLVRKRTYEALARIVRHHVLGSSPETLGHAMDLAYRGMADKDRHVRLSSGRVFTELVRLFRAPGHNSYKLTEPLFAHVGWLLDTAKDTVKETVLLTVGFAGKAANREILGHVVGCLIAQLGKQNPILKGTAYMQLIALTKHHELHPYSLVSPYMARIAPFVVSRMCTQPGLLMETCRFLSSSQPDFLSVTLPQTLPPLFAACDLRVLESIGKEVSKKPSHLFLNHSHRILAYVFLLQGPGQTNKSLTFILKVLTDAADNANIDIQSVVKSCIVPLLVEIVIVMGDEDAGKVEMALHAFKKVEKSLVVPRRGQRSQSSQTPGEFLKSYMLGVISDMNDMLQDLRGKKSIDSKRQILRSLGAFITQIGPPINNVAPQIMATMQTMLAAPDLVEITLETWYKFLSTLGPSDVGSHVGPTSASFVSSWSTFSSQGRGLAKRSLEYIIFDVGEHLGKYLDELVDLASIPELRTACEKLVDLRSSWTPKEKLQRILERSFSDNLTVAVQSLGELKSLMLAEHKVFISDLASGDIFDPMVGQILAALFAAAGRDGDDTESLRLLAFECIGVLGAVDPDRCEIGFSDPRMIVLSNFMDEGESVIFALHLIKDVLVGAFRSTSDIKYQSHLAYTIQELLRFCKFTPGLVAAGPTSSIPMKVRSRWNSLPKQVLETVTPLLEARFTLNQGALPELQHPIYPSQSTYREWIQLWTAHLITKASGATAQTIFSVFGSAVRSKDAAVAHHLLPHLALNILISGSEKDAQDIRSEFIVVLEDQVDAGSDSTADKKLLSAQAVFMLLDHLNKWVRFTRQDFASKKPETKRSRVNPQSLQTEEQLLRVDSILSSIDQKLMAKAAFQCKAYARSLMNFERQIVTLRERSAPSTDFPDYFEHLHEIYAHLDEPDGMEGVSTLILSPSLEHQIRQHESTGHWTSAQSCWEVRLQQAPDNLEFHLGLLRCLRNLGHYDTLRTHVKGVLTRNPGWDTALAGFQVEGAWMVGAWSDVQDLVDNTSATTSPIVMARLLLAMRAGDSAAIANSLSAARVVLGAPITASGAREYRRSYEAVLDLHLTHELELIHHAMASLSDSSQGSGQFKRRTVLSDLSHTLSARLDATLPTFRVREPVLSMRRTAFALSSTPRPTFSGEIGRSWLASAKIARKAGQWQTAYSAMLQAQQSKTQFSFIESAKLVKATGEPLRALQELENSMRLFGVIEDSSDVVDLTDDDETKKMKAKSQVLRARWMNESDRFEFGYILKAFQTATDLWPKWESGQYHLGQFHDECFKNLTAADQKSRGTRMNLFTVKCFAKAIKYGSKYVYQTIPRLLTLWLDMGEDRKLSTGELFKKLNTVVSDAIKTTPMFKWYTAFPQIVSRVGHSNPDVYSVLSSLIMKVIQEYPNQALWLFTSVVKSTKANRGQRGKDLLDQLKSNPRNGRSQVPSLISQCLSMTNELLALCDYAIDDDHRKSLSMSKDFPRLASLKHSSLIIPLQESLTASLPPTSSSDATYQPFPSNAPTFEEFLEEIDIMRSLAKPRKITIRGSNGQIYMFLGKPKDDLRKDARLMDFNAIINKLLKTNSESRRRQLHIRTYGVVTLNEECGFIQWVPNTIPVRPVLVKAYDARRVKNWSGEMNDTFKKIKDASDKDAGQLFLQRILPLFPPVFHEWFIETFPEPSAWLASRLAYGRTAAVMSMVGFILGLGDRHCENILLDTNTGDVVHVDFNCLFEKGKTLETPERVPFRLTQNIIDGLGVTGVEGVFRIACEVTMQLLRDNKDSLMSVLDAFIHDPLVEWEDEKRKLEREPSRRNNVKASVDLRMLAKNALNPIEKKLKGIYSTSKEKQEREISTSNLVQMLIQEATDSANLAKMYPGWAPWH